MWVFVRRIEVVLDDGKTSFRTVPLLEDVADGGVFVDCLASGRALGDLLGAFQSRSQRLRDRV